MNKIRIYALIDEKGNIFEVGDAGFNFFFDIKEIELNHPDKKVIELTEEDKIRIENQLEYFIYTNGKIEEKSYAEKKKIERIKKDWERYNTIEGLREQIKKIEKIKRSEK